MSLVCSVKYVQLQLDPGCSLAFSSLPVIIRDGMSLFTSSLGRTVYTSLIIQLSSLACFTISMDGWIIQAGYTFSVYLLGKNANIVSHFQKFPHTVSVNILEVMLPMYINFWNVHTRYYNGNSYVYIVEEWAPRWIVKWKSTFRTACLVRCHLWLKIGVCTYMCVAYA